MSHSHKTTLDHHGCDSCSRSNWKHLATDPNYHTSDKTKLQFYVCKSKTMFKILNEDVTYDVDRWKIKENKFTDHQI